MPTSPESAIAAHLRLSFEQNAPPVWIVGSQVVYVQFNYVAPGLAAKALETELAAPVLGDRKLVMRFMTKLY